MTRKLQRLLQVYILLGFGFWFIVAPVVKGAAMDARPPAPLALATSEPTPTPILTGEPTPQPAQTPTSLPTPSLTASPTQEPTATASPVAEPTAMPTSEASSQPAETAESTPEPGESTEIEPTDELTPIATVAVTATPTAVIDPIVTVTPGVELTTTVTSEQPGELPDIPVAEATQHSPEVTQAEIDQSADQATGIIEGVVRYQGRVDYTGIEVKVTGPGHEILGTNEGSQFAINNLTAGDYSVVVDADRYLPTCTAVTVDAAGITKLSQAVLYGGDTDDDDQIRINDVTLIGSNLGLTSSSTPSMNPRADINADGQVNIQDLSILGGNFEKKGCQNWST